MDKYNQLRNAYKRFLKYMLKNKEEDILREFVKYNKSIKHIIVIKLMKNKKYLHLIPRFMLTDSYLYEENELLMLIQFSSDVVTSENNIEECNYFLEDLLTLIGNRLLTFSSSGLILANYTLHNLFYLNGSLNRKLIFIYIQKFLILEDFLSFDVKNAFIDSLNIPGFFKDNIFNVATSIKFLICKIRYSTIDPDIIFSFEQLEELLSNNDELILKITRDIIYEYKYILETRIKEINYHTNIVDKVVSFKFLEQLKEN